MLPIGRFEEQYRQDYQVMRENMIYGVSPTFERLMETLNNVM